MAGAVVAQGSENFPITGDETPMGAPGRPVDLDIDRNSSNGAAIDNLYDGPLNTDSIMRCFCQSLTCQDIIFSGIAITV